MLSERVAVIVPVYNVEKYLTRCLDSICKQTYKNLEIVIVDDGSDDKSGKICDSFSEIDKRIKVYHNSNHGLSAARNFGIDKSKSDFITFVDSDDYLEVDNIQYLMEILKKYGADIAICDTFNDFETQIRPMHQNIDFDECLSSHEAIEEMFYSERFDDSAWNKIYKRNLFDDVRFPEDWYQAEEASTTYKLMLHAERLAIGTRCLYHYVQRDGALSRVEYKPTQMLMQRAGKECLEIIEVQAPEIIKAAKRRYVYDCFWVLRRIMPVSKDYPEDVTFLMNEIKKYSKGVFFDRRAKARDRCGIVALFFGSRFFEAMWNIYARLRVRWR